jgi:hypothetical protein
MKVYMEYRSWRAGVQASEEFRAMSLGTEKVILEGKLVRVFIPITTNPS